MPKDKESRLVSLKRCVAFNIKPGRKTPMLDRASVELVTPVTGAYDEVQPSATSTLALPPSSPPASLSTSFLPIRVEQQQLTVPLLTSTPNTSFTPGYYSPSALPSPVSSPIYSLPGALKPLTPVEFLPGPPTPAPPRPLTASPARVSAAPTQMYCDMGSLRVQLRLIRPAPRTSPLFAAPPQLVIPEPQGARVQRLPGVTVSEAVLRERYNRMLNASSWLDLRVNRPYPYFQLFSNKLKNVISKVSPLLVFYESQGENLFSDPSIWELYNKNLSEVRDIVESANNLL